MNSGRKQRGRTAPSRGAGYWIKDFKNSVMCSNCKQQFNWENYDETQDEFISAHDECPLCGALMDGEYKSVSINELINLRNTLYENDAITMNGLHLINELIAKYEVEK